MSGTRAENEFPQASPAAAVAPADRQDRILQILAERALLETGATSVAIGLLCDGTVTCRATAGLAIAWTPTAVLLHSGGVDVKPLVLWGVGALAASFATAAAVRTVVRRGAVRNVSWWGRRMTQ